MRLVLDLADAPDDHIAATAGVNDGQPISFSGWLALVRLIEDAQHGDDQAWPTVRPTRKPRHAVDAGKEGS